MLFNLGTTLTTGIISKEHESNIIGAVVHARHDDAVATRTAVGPTEEALDVLKSETSLVVDENKRYLEQQLNTTFYLPSLTPSTYPSSRPAITTSPSFAPAELPSLIATITPSSQPIASLKPNKTTAPSNSPSTSFPPTKAFPTWEFKDGFEQIDEFSDGGFGYQVVFSGDIAVVGAPYVANNLTDTGVVYNSGAIYAYVWDGTNWNFDAKIAPDDVANGDQVGSNGIAISGDTVIVGAIGDDVNGYDSGSAYVFVRESAGTWTQQAKLTKPNGEKQDYFGTSVAIDGDTALVGAFNNIKYTGSAHVYARDETGAWEYHSELIPDDMSSLKSYGISVALEDGVAIIGCTNDDGNYTSDDYGAAYVFAYNGNDWTQEAKLTVSDIGPSALFGSRIALSGDTAIIGALQDDREYFDYEIVSGYYTTSYNQIGAAYVFVRDENNSWSQQAKLSPDYGNMTLPSTGFGKSVSISGDVAVVGAPFSPLMSSSVGYAYIFERDGGEWKQSAMLSDESGSNSLRFGYSVSVADDQVLIGTYQSTKVYHVGPEVA
ncbi:hypothetical protein ACHAXS_006116 [Conticribra weissflogii]